MFISALLLAASAISLPQFDMGGLQNYFFKKFDFNKLTRQDAAVGVTVNLWIEPHGRIAGCWIGRMIGNQQAAKGLCPILLGMYAVPARDEKGKRTYGLVTVNFFVPPGPSKETDQTFAASLLAKPNAGDREDELTMRTPATPATPRDALTISVTADGSVGACARGALPEEVFEEACANAKGKAFVVRRGDKGQAVPYVRRVILVPTAPQSTPNG